MTVGAQPEPEIAPPPKPRPDITIQSSSALPAAEPLRASDSSRMGRSAIRPPIGGVRSSQGWFTPLRIVFAIAAATLLIGRRDRLHAGAPDAPRAREEEARNARRAHRARAAPAPTHRRRSLAPAPEPVARALRAPRRPRWPRPRSRRRLVAAPSAARPKPRSGDAKLP